jgi:hypothetical protein
MSLIERLLRLYHNCGRGFNRRPVSRSIPKLVIYKRGAASRPKAPVAEGDPAVYPTGGTDGTGSPGFGGQGQLPAPLLESHNHRCLPGQGGLERSITSPSSANHQFRIRRPASSGRGPSPRSPGLRRECRAGIFPAAPLQARTPGTGSRWLRSEISPAHKMAPPAFCP